MAAAAPKAVGLNSGPRSAPSVLGRSRLQHGSLGGGHKCRKKIGSNGNPKHGRETQPRGLASSRPTHRSPSRPQPPS